MALMDHLFSPSSEVMAVRHLGEATFEFTDTTSTVISGTVSHGGFGGEASSVISQLMASHKVSQDKLNDRQRKAAHQAEKGKARELANLEGGFRVERWKVIEACKKAAIAREEAEQREQQRAAKDDRERFMGEAAAPSVPAAGGASGGRGRDADVEDLAAAAFCDGGAGAGPSPPRNRLYVSATR